MTFNDLVKANNEIKTTDIKGKDYAEVNQRIKVFRMLYPEGSITTELVSNNDGVCIFRAMICDDSGKVLGTGTAYEKENSTFINKTSYIENCETSAVGRALGMVGIGIDVSVASAEEVKNAMLNQEKKTTPKKAAPVEVKKSPSDGMTLAELRTRILEFVAKKGWSKEKIESVLDGSHAKTIQEMALPQCRKFFDYYAQREEI